MVLVSAINLAKVGCGLGALNFFSLAVAPNMAISSYFKREPKEKKIASMLFRSTGLYALGYGLLLGSMIRDNNLTKGAIASFSVFAFSFFGFHVHMLTSGLVEECGIEKTGLYPWLVINPALGILSFLACKEM
jgi:hypothetical protein